MASPVIFLLGPQQLLHTAIATAQLLNRNVAGAEPMRNEPLTAKLASAEA